MLPIVLAAPPRPAASPWPNCPCVLAPQQARFSSVPCAHVRSVPSASCWGESDRDTTGRLTPIWLRAVPRSDVSPSPNCGRATEDAGHHICRLQCTDQPSYSQPPQTSRPDLTCPLSLAPQHLATVVTSCPPVSCIRAHAWADPLNIFVTVSALALGHPRQSARIPARRTRRVTCKARLTGALAVRRAK